MTCGRGRVVDVDGDFFASLDLTWEGNLKNRSDLGVWLQDRVAEGTAISAVADTADVKVPDVELDSAGGLKHLHGVSSLTRDHTGIEIDVKVEIDVRGVDLLGVSVSGVVGKRRHDDIVGTIMLLKAVSVALSACHSDK